MKSKHIIFLFMILVFFGYSRSCPNDFPIDVRYFPYEEETILSFRNAQGDTLSTTTQNIMQSKDKNIPWGSKSLCTANYSFSPIGKVQINGSLNALANPDDSHYHTILLSIDILYNNFTNYYNKEKIIEGNNYNVFGDTILLYDDQQSVTIIKGKGITEWTDGDGEVWKLIE
ncbi:MAG: hypothetical protein WC142_01820 [Bacteroidales bacterium]|jgi:hypothetical protein|nr:hypothetical protein [Bacteroidales bacterium]MDD3329737.1 hypothetical protein [Bacteroidales bacterium]MDD3690473.1 hypothetical protein [Bacteroidales bacterium]MDD4044336.1 hypothetical protein [Bacteroidales bacterium]MDD4581186.1 hypothetical protein [Bacteroidales bacterium]